MGRKVCMILILFLLSFIGVKLFNYFTYEFSHTGNTKYGDALISPDGRYAAQMYFDNYGGAAGGVDVIVNIRDLENKSEEQTVYFSDGKGSPLLQWQDSHHLEIQNYNNAVNRSVILKVPYEIYDEHGKACKVFRVKKQLICYDKDSY